MRMPETNTDTPPRITRAPAVGEDPAVAARKQRDLDRLLSAADTLDQDW